MNPRVEIAHDGAVHKCVFHNVPVIVLAPPRVRWWWKPWTWRRKRSSLRATITNCVFDGPRYDAALSQEGR